jgi:hypothetical protein
MRRFLILYALMMAFAALADTGTGATKGTGGRRGKPQDFQATEMTDEEREAARVRARYRMGTWREAEPVQAEPKFPWMPIGFTLLSFAVVAPFAWNAYRGTAKELANTATFGPQPRRRRAPTPAAEPEQD